MGEVTPISDFVREAAEELGLTGRPLIQIRAGEIAAAADAVEGALLEAKVPFFVRGGLVRPFAQSAPASGGSMTSVPALAPVDAPTILDHAARTADMVKFDGRAQGYVPTDLPTQVANVILSRTGGWKFPPLASVISTPTMRPNGTILSRAGYDETTRTFLVDPLELPEIPDNPTKDDAKVALELLENLLADFPFIARSDHAVALSGLLTTVARGALSVAPLHAITAHVAGSGKSYLVDIAAALSIGNRAPALSVGRSDEETEKRLGAALLAARPILSIDNVNGELGGDFLCQAVERPMVAMRPLGGSQIVNIENRTTIFATGNNIAIRGDMTRRTLLCSLDANEERPELRRFGANPFGAVMGDRGKYVAAALTVIRAYVVAGYPEQLPALASFEDWSRMVRSALVWLGHDDPCDTMIRARDSDPERSNLCAVATAWRAIAGDEWMLAGEIIARATEQSDNDDLRGALMAVAEHRRGGKIDPTRLGKYLARNEGRIVEGVKAACRIHTHSKSKIWRFESI